MFGYTESPRTLSNISHKFFTRSNLQNLRKRTPGLYFFQRAHLVSGRSTAFMLSPIGQLSLSRVLWLVQEARRGGRRPRLRRPAAPPAPAAVATSSRIAERRSAHNLSERRLRKIPSDKDIENDLQANRLTKSRGLQCFLTMLFLGHFYT